MVLDPRKIYAYLKSKFAIKKSTNGWFTTRCPFECPNAKSNKFCFSIEREQVKCWQCAYKCSVADFVMDYEQIKYKEAKHLIQNQEFIGLVDAEVLQSVRVVQQSSVELPAGFNSILDGETVLGRRARNYLAGRGFNLEELDARGFGYCDQHTEEKNNDYFGYIIIPFKRNGQLQYFIGRDFLGNQFLRYKNPETAAFGVGKADLLYNEDALDMYDEIWLLEGCFDAETIGPEAVASMGWSLSTLQKSKLLRSGCKRLVFCPDKRNATEDFYQLAVRAAVDFTDHKDVYVINTDHIPGSGKDVNDLGREAFLRERKKTFRLTNKKAMEIIME